MQSHNERRRELPFEIPGKRGSVMAVAVVVGVIVLVALFQVWQWFFCRVEIDPGETGVLIAKMGRNLKSGDILAPDSSYKGIQIEPLSEGRHFFNPIFWDWEIHRMLEVPAGHVGVKIRHYGTDFSEEDLKAGKIIADVGQKGILRDVLQPGKYRINPYAENVEIHKAVDIPVGFVGVVTNYGGQEAVGEIAGSQPVRSEPESSAATIADDDEEALKAEIPVSAKGDTSSSFLVEAGKKGVVRDVLTPGIHYLNPYLNKVHLMDCRSQKFELVGDDALKFPSSDAFEMTVFLTVEWAIDPVRAPEIFVRIGELHPDAERNEILQKVIIPAARGFGRIEGSKYSALDYIIGDSRQIFQNTLFQKIKLICEPKGIIIKSVLINDIEPPQEIALPIREREIAREELNRNGNQLLQAKAEQSLARSEELAKMERDRVSAQTAQKIKIIDIQNQQKVALINQQRRLTMERTLLEAARKEAEAVTTRGKAIADVIILDAHAEAEALKKAVEAFKGPEHTAYYEFLNRMAPSIKTLFANTEGVFGRIFSDILPVEK